MLNAPVCHQRTFRRPNAVGLAAAILAAVIVLGLPACCNTQGGGNDNHNASQNNSDNTGNQNENAGDGGVGTIALDARLRPERISSGATTVGFAWADDSSSVDVTVRSGDTTYTYAVDVDFSDPALHEALDQVTEETGEDVSALHTWIEDHPGEVAAVMSGEQSAPWLHAHVLQQTSADAEVEEHLYRMTMRALALTRTVYELYVAWQHSTDLPQFVDLQREAWEAARDERLEFLDEFRTQLEECTRCTSGCAVDCAGRILFACCFYALGAPICTDLDERACAEAGGAPHAGATCDEYECESGVGACCLTLQVGDAGSPCIDADATFCANLGGQFTAGLTCAEAPPCAGACHTLYDTAEGQDCCDCRVTSLDDCRGDPNFNFFNSGFACPGACYTGEGETAFCAQMQEEECIAIGGIFFHESLCRGSCFYSSGDACTCADLTERECQALDGSMIYDANCLGACYHAEGDRDVCTQTTCGACDSLLGLYRAGHPCE